MSENYYLTPVDGLAPEFPVLGQSEEPVPLPQHFESSAATTLY
jgi:hypothetical protein